MIPQISRSRQYVTMYHLTPRPNVSSIRRHGLLTAKSRGQRQCIWVVDAAGLMPLIQHLAEYHGLPWWEFACLRVSVPRQMLVRCGREHRSYLFFDVPRSQVRIDKAWELFVRRARRTLGEDGVGASSATQ